MGFWRRSKEKEKKSRTVMTPSSEYYIYDEDVLENYVRRLSEILEECGEIGKHFDKLRDRNSINTRISEHEINKQLASDINESRIPGFCAYKLAQEGLLLMELIAVRSLSLHKIYEQSESSQQLNKLKGVENYVNELEPMIRQTLDSMSHFSTLEAKKIIESMVAQPTKTNKDKR